MKTFEEFLAEGKKNDEMADKISHYYDMGRQEGNPSFAFSTRHIKPMTPEEVLKNSGRMAIMKHIKAQEKAASIRRAKAIKRILKKHASLEETVISYPSSVGGDVYEPLTGKKRHLPKGKAMAKRSSSSAGGNGD